MTTSDFRATVRRLHPDVVGDNRFVSALRNVLAQRRRAKGRFKVCGCGATIRAHHRQCRLCRTARPKALASGPSYDCQRDNGAILALLLRLVVCVCGLVWLTGCQSPPPAPATRTVVLPITGKRIEVPVPPAAAAAVVAPPVKQTWLEWEQPDYAGGRFQTFPVFTPVLITNRLMTNVYEYEVVMRTNLAAAWLVQGQTWSNRWPVNMDLPAAYWRVWAHNRLLP